MSHERAPTLLLTGRQGAVSLGPSPRPCDSKYTQRGLREATWGAPQAGASLLWVQPLHLLRTVALGKNHPCALTTDSKSQEACGTVSQGSKAPQPSATTFLPGHNYSLVVLRKALMVLDDLL